MLGLNIGDLGENINIFGSDLILSTEAHIIQRYLYSNFPLLISFSNNNGSLREVQTQKELWIV